MNPICDHLIHAVETSADRGNLEMLKWVWNNLSNSEKPLALSASGFSAFKLAKQNNHQDITDRKSVV